VDSEELIAEEVEPKNAKGYFDSIPISEEKDDTCVCTGCIPCDMLMRAEGTRAGANDFSDRLVSLRVIILQIMW